jgi:uncharacterized membrane-anchored protein
MKKLAFILLLFAFASASAASAEDVYMPAWTAGPATVNVGGDLAQVELAEEYIFAGSEDSRKIMELYGNPVSGQEAGIIMPRSEDKNWFVLFEFDPVGYVKDDDKDELDADAILKSIREGTEAANEQREKMGAAPMHIVGWYEPPRYDDATNNLTWAVLGESEGERIVNYNTRLLGREGYTSVVLVTDPANLDTDKHDVEAIVSAFSYKKGKRYSEYVQGDKVAKYGLVALMAGGAGAAAAKVGLFKALAKAWKAVVAVGVAAIAAIGGLIRRLTGKGKGGAVEG